MRSKLVLEASQFAWQAHLGQLRKDKAPYWCHLSDVAALIRWAGLPEEVQAAAWLHDTVEDCPDVTAEVLREKFGDEVTELVLDVTDVSKKSDGNRATRKAIDRKHLAQASPYGQSIKLADLIDNTRTIVRVNRNFAKVYLKEKELLLPLLSRGHPELMGLAQRVLADALRELGGSHL